MKRISKDDLVIAALGVAVLVVLLSTGVLPSPGTAADVPDQEAKVTCYKWVENGTAQVDCPDRVYEGDAVINITVKPCSEYEYKSDEKGPCRR